jgi:hypothetical protein
MSSQQRMLSRKRMLSRATASIRKEAQERALAEFARIERGMHSERVKKHRNIRGNFSTTRERPTASQIRQNQRRTARREIVGRLRGQGQINANIALLRGLVASIPRNRNTAPYQNFKNGNSFKRAYEAFGKRHGNKEFTKHLPSIRRVANYYQHQAAIQAALQAAQNAAQQAAQQAAVHQYYMNQHRRLSKM